MSRLRSLAVLALLVAILVGVTLWLRSPADLPTLRDRYAESWGGRVGDHVVIRDGITLPAAVGRRQMFTPAVCAPVSTALSNVWLSVCLPLSLHVPDEERVGPPRLNADGSRQCFVGKFLEPILAGTCGNPEQALFFTPVIAGRHQVSVAISSVERPEVRLSFFVEAK